MLKKTIKKVVPANLLKFTKDTASRAKKEILNVSWPLRRMINHKIRKIFPPAIPQNKDGKVYIHLGCWDQKNDKFINVDTEAFPHVHHVRNVQDLSVFENETADLIYASHLLEHISHLKLHEVLKEWARVLKRGGILRLAVPDLDKIISFYNSSGNDINQIVAALMGGQDYEYNYHKAVFNEKYLSDLLKNAGFTNIRHWDAKKENFGFEDFAKNYRGSLNLEGQKI